MKKILMILSLVIMTGILTSFTPSTEAKINQAADVTAVVNLVPNSAMQLLVPLCQWERNCCFRQPGFIYCGYVELVLSRQVPSATCTHCGNPWCQITCLWCYF